MHFPPAPFPRIRDLTFLSSVKAFFPASSPPSCVIAPGWHYPFPGPLAAVMTIFGFLQLHTTPRARRMSHIPSNLHYDLFSRETKHHWIQYPGSPWSLFLICTVRLETPPWSPLNNKPHTNLQTKFSFSVFCPVFPEMLFSQQAHNSPRSQPSF